MKTSSSRASALTLVAALLIPALLAGCSSVTEPRHTDVDRARQAWLSGRATTYTFEMAMASSWLRKSDFFRVQIENDRVVATTAVNGLPTRDMALTIDALWDRLLTARASGALNSAEFDERGVPVETDMGSWPADGGLHYSVRNFVQHR